MGKHISINTWQEETMPPYSQMWDMPHLLHHHQFERERTEVKLLILIPRDRIHVPTEKIRGRLQPTPHHLKQFIKIQHFPATGIIIAIPIDGHHLAIVTPAEDLYTKRQGVATLVNKWKYGNSLQRSVRIRPPWLIIVCVYISRLWIQ